MSAPSWPLAWPIPWMEVQLGGMKEWNEGGGRRPRSPRCARRPGGWGADGERNAARVGKGPARGFDGEAHVVDAHDARRTRCGCGVELGGDERLAGSTRAETDDDSAAHAGHVRRPAIAAEDKRSV